MSYIALHVKVSMMSDFEALARRERLYNTTPSSSEAERAAMYMELGLIEQRLTESYGPFRPRLPSILARANPFCWLPPPPDCYDI